MNVLTGVVICFLYFYNVNVFGYTARYGSYRNSDKFSNCETCDKNVDAHEWLIANRQADFGWDGETHRAIIALVAGNYWDNIKDKDLMLNQLQLELAKTILRNSTNPTAIGDLALYIHAFIATGLDPRNFHGQNLVSILEHKFSADPTGHPIAALALCNARALDENHLRLIAAFVQNNNKHDNRELKAMALKAFACAIGEWPNLFKRYQKLVTDASKALAALQSEEGNFGNFYSTALVVQALVASEASFDLESALDFLQSQFSKNKNIMSAYYLLVTLQCKNVPFVKNLTLPSAPLFTDDGFPSLEELRSRQPGVTIAYEIRKNVDFVEHQSMSIKIPFGASFFDAMRLAGDNDENFRFNYTVYANHITVYSIGGIVNDGQVGKYWDLERTYRNKTGYWTKTIAYESTQFFVPQHGEVYSYLYRNAFNSV